MKLVQNNKKKIIIVFILLMFVTVLSSIKAYSIKDVQFVIPYLETDNFFNDVLRTLGEWIFDLIGSLLTYAENGFTSLMRWDIMNLPKIKEIMRNMDVVMYSLLFIAFIGVVIVKMFMFENNFKTIYNVFMTMIVISSLSIILGLLSGVKNDLVMETNNILKGSSNDSMADVLYKENTVDILQSMKKGRMIKLNQMGNLDLKYVNHSLRINRNKLNEYFTYNDDGTKEVEELNDGVFGFGQERYYRYKTDYLSVNVTVVLSVIVYILAIFKLSYLVWQWLSVNIFGKLGLAKGFWDLGNVGKVLKNGANTIGGMVILYFSMMLFSVLCGSILSSNDLDNWLVKSIVVFSIGMAIIVGSGFVNEFLGIDDGSSFALKSIFMGNRLAKMGKGVVNGARGAVGAPIKAIDKINDTSMKSGNNDVINDDNHPINPNDSFNNNLGRGKDKNGDLEKKDVDDKHKDRQNRFQKFYDKKYSDKNGDVNEQKEDLKNQNSEKGSKEGYSNQRNYKPYYNRPYKKELPEWFYDQSKVEIDMSDFNEEQLQEDLKKLRSESKEKK